MESVHRRIVVGVVVVLGLTVQLSLAGTSVGTGKQLAVGATNSIKSPAESTERGGWGWGYPTGHSWSSPGSSFGLPLVFIPLIYFGILWCVLLFGLAAFHHAPLHHHKGHGGQHHRYRRYDDFEDDYAQQTQQHILSSI